MLRRNPERAARPVNLVDHAEVAAVEVIDLADEDGFVPVVQQEPIWPAAAELAQDCAICFSVLGTNGPPMACPLCGNVLCLPCVQQAFVQGAGTIGHVNQCPIARCEVRDAAGLWLPGREFRPVTVELMRLHTELRERDGGRVALRGEAEDLAGEPEYFDDDVSEAAEILVEEDAMEGAEVLEFGAVDVGDFAAGDVFRVDGGNVEDDPLVAPLSPVHVPGSPLNVPGGAVDGINYGAVAVPAGNVVAERRLWATGRRLIPSRFRGPDGMFLCPECGWRDRHRGHAFVVVGCEVQSSDGRREPPSDGDGGDGANAAGGSGVSGGISAA